jgi:hypothetical protein
MADEERYDAGDPQPTGVTTPVTGGHESGFVRAVVVGV